MRLRLTKIKGGSALLTESVTGDGIVPEEGRSFWLISKPLDPTAYKRAVQTSPVRAIEVLSTGWEFDTETGSRYRVEILEQIESEEAA